MTILEAINICLVNGAGVRPVSSETDPNGGASAFIDRVRVNVLKGSYSQNIEEIDLVRDTSDEISIPKDVLTIRLPRPFVVRNKQIWNRKDRTHKMTRDFPNTTIAVDVPFEELDPSLQDFIAWSSAAEFSAAKRGAGSERAQYCQDQALTKEVEMSMADPAEVLQHENPQYHTPGSDTRSSIWCNL